MLEKRHFLVYMLGFPGGASGKEPACQCWRPKRPGFDPCSGKDPRRKHGTPLQCSCLQKSLGRRAWQATAHRLAQSQQHWRDLAARTVAPLAAQAVKNPLAVGKAGFSPWVGKICWRSERLPSPVFLPGEFHGQRSLVGYGSGDLKE